MTTTAPAEAQRFVVPAVALAERRHHDDHVLFWQLHGSGAVAVGADDLPLTEGLAAWVPAGAPHTVRVHEDSVLLPLLFPADATATTLQTPRVLPVAGHLRTLLLALMQSQSTLLRPAIDLERRVLPLIEEVPTLGDALPMPTSRAAAEVAAAIAFDPGDGRTIAELARSVHVSERTLERAFQAETGMPPRRWRRLARLEAAATLLRSGAGTAAVANRVGYSNLSAFHRAFAAHFGTTPGRMSP